MLDEPRTLLRRHFGYSGFRPGQEELIQAVMSERDALGVLPTGGGKSVCYQIPALALGGLALVVTPLVSLMEDQVRRALDGGLRGAYLSANLTPTEKRAVLRDAREGRLDVLFVAPERLELDTFQRELRSLDVRLMAVDEAHCISEWGHEFRPSYRRIGQLRTFLSCPVLALTATATPDVRDDIVRSLSLRSPLVVLGSFDRPNLSWTVVRVGREGGRVRATYRLLSERSGSAIVYAPTRGMVETVRDRLAASGVSAQAYHAGLSRTERTAVQSAFMAGECRVVVATNAFGMGIDKADVRTVIHMALPGTLEAYYQEAGRAGRDGLDAACVAFFAPSDLRFARAMIQALHPPRRRIRSALRRLGRLQRRERTVVLGAKILGDELGRDGLMAALERLGAVSRSPVDGQRGNERWISESQRRWTYEDHRLDPEPLVARRRVALAKLEAVRGFACARRCRRGALLRYFGEQSPDRCGLCDRCGKTLSIRIRAT